MDRLLVANRGEIAIRVCRAAASLGVATVALRTVDERDAQHLAFADEVVDLPGTGVAAYLDVAEVVRAAQRAGVDAVHPGYGFLSESPQLAQACTDAGLTFVGPSVDALQTLGDKTQARAVAERLELPVLGAVKGGEDAARSLLDSLGPGASVVVKAVAGGGGRGIRLVTNPADLGAALRHASSEAERAFGDGAVYVEEYLPRARHIEVQIVGDGTDVVAAGDRDCSIQIRRQKVIELAPAITVPGEIRRALAEAATRIATAVGYAGIGTFEFLVAEGRNKEGEGASGAPAKYRREPATGELRGDRSWAFLEANPRVQVEHTVTEEVTGLDLVAIQLQIAAGRSLADLDLRAPVAQRGIAVQSRINAVRVEPGGDVVPTVGTIDDWVPPTGPGTRVDAALGRGAKVTGSYDPLLAKIITHDGRNDLRSAIAHARRALAETTLTGVETNIALLQAILQRHEVQTGQATTTFVGDHLTELVTVPSSADLADDADASSGLLHAHLPSTVVSVGVAPGDKVGPGQELLVLEAMKMEHPVLAPVGGVVDHVAVAPGDGVDVGQLVVVLQTDEAIDGDDEAGKHVDLGRIRPDLQHVRDRHQPTLDAARPEAVDKRHQTGHRTARENIAHLLDDGSFREYGALAIAAQRRRRSVEDLVARTPADGIITGIGRIGADIVGEEASACAVLAYDYTVLAGTQGYLSHRKTDRMLDVAHRRRIPVVLFAEGGGGRPGDTDTTSVSGLDVETFAKMGRLSGWVPTVGIVTGRCFAGNAALLGCCDVVIATRDANIGMGGPAMIEGGGLGVFRPEDIGPSDVQSANGVIDVLVEDEAEAVGVAKRYLSYFQGDRQSWDTADSRELRHVIPENRRRPYDVRRLVSLVSDTDSVLELRSGFGAGVVTALARLESRPVGIIANNPMHLGGAIDADAADKLTRFIRLCDVHGLPVVSLCDTPGFMVGPDAERTATVRHFARLFVAGAHLRVPLVTVVVRKGYGLGAQAMAGGSFHSPLATVAWPTGEIGGMGLEGAVRLGYRRELEAAADDDARRKLFDELVATAYEQGRATNAAQAFELDDVIDPADTRRWVVDALGSSPGERPQRGYLDTW